jgi:hypothetical protein
MIVLGVLIGWNFPQPEYARKAQSLIVAKIRAKWTEWKGT